MSLVSYVESMNRKELRDLAKNRWIDEHMQAKIYEQGYKSANIALARNPFLDNGIRDKLWNDGGKRSYVLKYELIINCHYEGQDDKYDELYFSHKKRFQSTYMGRWRMYDCFLMRGNITNVKAPIIDDITEWLLDWTPEFAYESNRIAKSIINHPSLSVESCVKMTTFPAEQIRKWAFERLVEINRSNSVRKAG